MAPTLSLVGHEQGPDIAGLMVRTYEALKIRLVLGHEEDGIVQIPRDLRIADAARIAQAVFDCSVSHVLDAG